MFAAGATDATALSLPTAPRTRAEILTPATTDLLQLHPAHLTLSSVPAPAAGACA
jgi:hypothetical protein